MIWLKKHCFKNVLFPSQNFKNYASKSNFPIKLDFFPNSTRKATSSQTPTVESFATLCQPRRRRRRFANWLNIHTFVVLVLSVVWCVASPSKSRTVRPDLWASRRVPGEKLSFLARARAQLGSCVSSSLESDPGVSAGVVACSSSGFNWITLSSVMRLN